MQQLITLLEVQDLIWITGVGIIVLVSLVQALSKKYSPWSWLLEQFGEAVNKKVIEGQERLEKKVDILESRMEENEKNDKRAKAKAARRRILRFADEVRLDQKHSQEFFNEVLTDIKTYQNYCKCNPTFENDKATVSIEIIEEVYKKCLKENSFL